MNNSGNYNSGNCNSGHYNSGDSNSGYYNSGNYNSGNYNSGNYNSGNCNSGYYNSGYYNSGHYNSGYYNSGNYNSGNYNSGWFNTNEPKMRFFNKECDFTYTEAIERDILPCFDVKLTTWVTYENMTTEEKRDIEYAKTTDGYLKTFSLKEAWATAWLIAKQEEKEKLFALPGFDPIIFEQITGIKLDNTKEIDKTKEEIEKLQTQINELKQRIVK